MQKIVAIIFVAVFSLHLPVFSQVNIWADTGCTENVQMTPYVAEGKNNVGIVVCPGGSYFWHDIEAEGHTVARWLQDNGISAFVLDYRTAYVPAFIFHHRLVFRGNRYPDPQDDLLQALRYVRKHADDYGIDTTKIGVMGFSAGGHLVMSSVELFDKSEWPAFVVPVYPVVTMVEECVHKRSRRGLLGDSRIRNAKLRDLLSLERHVPSDCPPVFLVNCKDDPVVDFRNSVLLDSALTSMWIKHEYIQFETGGHGFGACDDKGTPESREWKKMFLKWLKSIIR